MIRAFLRLVEWLDRRFPPRVTVTDEIFEGLTARIHAQGKTLASQKIELDDCRLRVVGLEKTLIALKEALVKGQIAAPKSEKDQLRDSFVKGEFGRGPSREELEQAAS